MSLDKELKKLIKKYGKENVMSEINKLFNENRLESKRNIEDDVDPIYYGWEIACLEYEKLKNED